MPAGAAARRARESLEVLTRTKSAALRPPRAAAAPPSEARDSIRWHRRRLPARYGGRRRSARSGQTRGDGIAVADDVLRRHGVGRCRRLRRGTARRRCRRRVRGPRGRAVCRELTLDRALNGHMRASATGDEHCARVGIVLGLGDQIGGDPSRSAGRRNDQDFARAGVEVDRAVAGHQRLGRRDIRVARTDDLVNARDRLASRTPAPQSACAPPTRNSRSTPASSAAAKHDRRRARTHRDNLAHPGHSGRNSRHQER